MERQASTAHRRKLTLAAIATLVAVGAGVVTGYKLLGDAIPTYRGSVGNFEASRPLLAFLRNHDGEAVRLKVGLDAESFDRDGEPQWGVVIERCGRPVPNGEQPDIVADDCSGTQLILTGPTTADSAMYLDHGGLYIRGYFAVDVDSAIRQGVATVGLKPLSFEAARAAMS